MNTKSLQNEKFHLDNNAKMVPFAGYNMPMWYSTIADEHNCVREKVGIFDVSHMGEFFVTGEMAKDFLQMVTTNDINKLTKGKVQYSSILNRSGGIIDDLLVYDMGENKYMLVVNASNMEKDFNWLNDNNNLGVEIKNDSDEYSLFAVQGQNAEKVCSQLFEEDLSEIKYLEDGFNVKTRIFIEDFKNIFSQTFISFDDKGGVSLSERVLFKTSN